MKPPAGQLDPKAGERCTSPGAIERGIDELHYIYTVVGTDLSLSLSRALLRIGLFEGSCVLRTPSQTGYTQLKSASQRSRQRGAERSPEAAVALVSVACKARVDYFDTRTTANLLFH